MSQPIHLGRDVTLIDLFDLGLKERTGSYILRAEELTIIETSASPSIPHLLKGLEQLNIDPSEIKNIIVTHIHLDHAGGVGLLLEKCPNAKVIVHPRGQRHLMNPSKLIAGARAVYGDLFDSLFHPILPVPEGRLVVKEDADSLEIGKNRRLTFLDTPGHSNHHFSIYDSFSNGIFTGDTIGVFYPQSKKHGFEFVLPSTSPNQFNPQLMLDSLARIESLNVERIYFGHYGMSENPKNVYEQIREWLPIFVDTAEQVLQKEKEGPFQKQTLKLSKELLEVIKAKLAGKGVSKDDELYIYLNVDLQVCAMGLIDYLMKS